MSEVFRQEKKFLITLDQYYRYCAKLTQLLHSDKHGTKDGYLIRSLYFDSIDDRDFEEKEEGVELRRKIRIRIYGPDSQFAKLEIKRKEGPLQKKNSLKITREEAEELIKGNYSILLKREEEVATECYYMMNQYCYRPKTIVSYNRKAFVAKENNIRITFDHHIKASESNFDLFSKNLNENYVMNPYLVVLEVKYNNFLLSYIKDMLEECDASDLSVSKYCMGRGISKHYNF